MMMKKINTIAIIIAPILIIMMFSWSLYHKNIEALIGWIAAYLYSFSMLINYLKPKKQPIVMTFHCISTSDPEVPCIKCTRNTEIKDGIITCLRHGKVKIEDLKSFCPSAIYPKQNEASKAN